jgi:hypothetical protein
MSLLLLLLSPAYPLLLLLLSTWCCCCCVAAVPGGIAGTAVSSGLQPLQSRQGQLLLHIAYRKLRKIFELKTVIQNFFGHYFRKLSALFFLFKPENIYCPRIFLFSVGNVGKRLKKWWM